MHNAPWPTVLACGAWQKNTACLLVKGQPVWSALHGDLSDPAACAALQASVQRLLAEHGAPIAAVAHDAHPDFFSTRLALSVADALGVPAVGVQHHHAHVAAVLAEHRLSGPVVGLALDGVGLGTDGQAWGGELLWLHGAQWQRLGHLWPLALPGGDRAAREPWRMAASALHALGRGHEVAQRFAPHVGHAAAAGVQQMLAHGLNCPPSSSAGRWFDAAAAALGLSLRQNGEAEAAQALEAAAARALAQAPKSVYENGNEDGHGPASDPPLPNGTCVDAHNRLDLRGLMPALFAAHDRAARRADTGNTGNTDATDSTDTRSIDTAAAHFHLALADALSHWALRAARQHGCDRVCLGGGCFHNRILQARVSARLRAAGLAVFRQPAPRCGDAGIALGQAWVAAQQQPQPLTSPEHPACA
jgi:hydrogenase maturation protein HypF